MQTSTLTDIHNPVIILVGPQMAENIGMAARAMANFGLTEMRLVSPRGGWPKKGAHSAASGAAHILKDAKLYETAEEAVADLSFVFATTARERGQMKRVVGPHEAASEIVQRSVGSQRVGIMFGRERTGLENDEISLADAIITFPVSPDFSSLNLAQAVLLVGYEWYSQITADALPFYGEMFSSTANKAMVLSFFDYLETELDVAGFYPPDKKPIMTRNMRDIFYRLEMTEQDVRTLRGAMKALVDARKNKKV